MISNWWKRLLRNTKRGQSLRIRCKEVNPNARNIVSSVNDIIQSYIICFGSKTESEWDLKLSLNFLKRALKLFITVVREQSAKNKALEATVPNCKIWYLSESNFWRKQRCEQIHFKANCFTTAAMKVTQKYFNFFNFFNIFNFFNFFNFFYFSSTRQKIDTLLYASVVLWVWTFQNQILFDICWLNGHWYQLYLQFILYIISIFQVLNIYLRFRSRYKFWRVLPFKVSFELIFWLNLFIKKKTFPNFYQKFLTLTRLKRLK
jgi:hypothetical protein